MNIPVIAIDGPSASGKGTIAAIVAQRLGCAYLDSGAIYRVTAYAALQRGIDLADEPALVNLASQLDLRFDGAEVYLDGQPVGCCTRRRRSATRPNTKSSVSSRPASPARSRRHLTRRWPRRSIYSRARPCQNGERNNRKERREHKERNS